MLKAKTIFCCLFVTLTCFFINSSSAVDKTPLTRNNQSFLTQCWEPETSSWQAAPLRESGKVHCKVENIAIRAFREAWLVHEPLHLSYALVNAPLSGNSLKRGRNLLSFAAFNGFRRVALWGMTNGADINFADGEQTTMLGAAIADKQPYMANFSVFYLKADPNTLYQSSGARITALRDMVNNYWSADAIEGMIEGGAVTRSQTEFEVIQSYLVQLAGSDRHLQLKAREMIDTLYLAGTLVNPLTARQAKPFYTDMLTEIDRHILYAIEHDELTQKELDQFLVHGRSFFHFLAFNGFNQTLKYLLRYRMAPEESSEFVHKRDRFGFDMLLAAIHSNDANSVSEVLRASKLAINQKVPSFRGFKNQGQKPLDLARKWQASPEVIETLLDNGATPLIQ